MGLLDYFAKRKQHGKEVGGASGFEKLRLVVRENYRYYGDGMVAHCRGAEYDLRYKLAIQLSEVFVKLTDGYYGQLAENYKKETEGRDPYAGLVEGIISNRAVVLDLAGRMFGLAFGIVLVKVSKICGRKILEENVKKYIDTWGIDNFYKGEVLGMALRYVRFVQNVKGRDPTFSHEFGVMAYALFYSKLTEDETADPMINLKLRSATQEAFGQARVEGLVSYFVEIGLLGEVIQG